MATGTKGVPFCAVYAALPQGKEEGPESLFSRPSSSLYCLKIKVVKLYIIGPHTVLWVMSSSSVNQKAITLLDQHPTTRSTLPLVCNNRIYYSDS